MKITLKKLGHSPPWKVFGGVTLGSRNLPISSKATTCIALIPIVWVIPLGHWDNSDILSLRFMFRKNLVPAWETFPKGGAWIIKVRKKNGVIGRLWEELLFACVGELFEEPDLVGVVLSSRSSQDLLSVWNSDNTNGDVRFRIGDRLRDILNLDESTQVEYKSFQSAINDGSSFRNAATYVYAAAAAGTTE